MIELLPLATYCALMSGTPGPNNVMLTASGAHFGYRASMPAILGIISGTTLQTALACVGLGALFAALPALQQLLRVAGALTMLWLAWRLAGSAAWHGQAPRRVGYAQAMGFQAVNPKSWIKALTIGSVFMPPGIEPLSGALQVSAVGALIALPCISMWALFGVAIGRLLTDERRRRAFNVMMAAALALLALMLLRPPTH